MVKENINNGWIELPIAAFAGFLLYFYFTENRWPYSDFALFIFLLLHILIPIFVVKLLFFKFAAIKDKNATLQRILRIAAITFTIVILSTHITLGLWYAKANSRGIIISDALEEYYHNNKEYPQNLDDLVPKYLADIPTPSNSWFAAGNFAYYTKGSDLRIISYPTSLLSHCRNICHECEWEKIN